MAAKALRNGCAGLSNTLDTSRRHMHGTKWLQYVRPRHGCKMAAIRLQKRLRWVNVLHIKEDAARAWYEMAAIH